MKYVNNSYEYSCNVHAQLSSFAGVLIIGSYHRHKKIESGTRPKGKFV